MYYISLFYFYFKLIWKKNPPNNVGWLVDMVLKVTFNNISAISWRL